VSDIVAYNAKRGIKKTPGRGEAQTPASLIGALQAYTIAVPERRSTRKY